MGPSRALADGVPWLVLEWRQTPDWEALVTYVEPRGRAVTEWLAADQLRPVADAT